MVGDIMNIWIVQYVGTTLDHLTSTVNVALTNAEKKPGRLQLRSISRQKKVSYHNSDGSKVQQGLTVNGDIGQAIKANEVQLLGHCGIQKSTQKRKRNGTQSIGIVGVVRMLAIWIGKPYQTSLNYLVINARDVAQQNGLRLTISLLYQRVARTILITYNRFVSRVTLEREIG